MKLQITQLNSRTLNFEYNVKQAKSILKNANEDVMTIFPELALSGSPLYETVLYDNVSKQALASAESLCNERKSCIVGMPLHNGNEKLNALLFIVKGEVIDAATKRNLTAFDRSFAKGNGFETARYENETIAFGFETDFEEFAAKGEKVDVVICVANNVFEVNKQQETINKFIPAVRKMACKFVYVNRCGAEGQFVFNGGSFVLNEKGNLCDELPLFEEETKIVDTNRLKLFTQSPKAKIEKMYHAVILGLRDYFIKNNISKAVLGLSGGIDSALVAKLAVDAIGKENVTGVLMPSEYSTDHSVKDALDLVNNLQIKHFIIPIKPLYDTALSSLNEVFANTQRGLAEENIQARLRCMVLMGVANKTGALLLNTSNKSEAAAGYGTLYGDTSGGIGLIGDMYKKDVWEMAKWLNRNGVVIPENSITKAPSAELSYGQKDSDSLPEYSLLDEILTLHLEGKMDREQILVKGYDSQTVDKVLHLLKINEWKRHQCCPCIKLSSHTFGIDRLMPVS
ncbi:MAG: NAD(+) synthase [Bacteroidales bacterium]|jgi:NAD+ synthase (glutamine-hydrolysing)|nr:NAD(+) synthase [Bacteroidales bacterium]